MHGEGGLSHSAAGVHVDKLLGATSSAQVLVWEIEGREVSCAEVNG